MASLPDDGTEAVRETEDERVAALFLHLIAATPLEVTELVRLLAKHAPTKVDTLRTALGFPVGALEQERDAVGLQMKAALEHNQVMAGAINVALRTHVLPEGAAEELRAALSKGIIDGG